MKIRNGHVSNSSSSSFILLTTKKTFNKKLDALKPWEKKYVKEVIGPHKNIKLYNKEGIAYSGTYCTDSMVDIWEQFRPESKTTLENGCEHTFVRKEGEFCQKCGAPTYVEQDDEGDNYEERSFEIMEDFFNSFKGEKDSYAEWKDF